MTTSTAPTASSTGSIGQIALTVTDVPRAAAFYGETLGLRRLPIPAPPSMAFFDCGGVRLMLSLPEGIEKDARIGGTVLYFKVDDLKGTHAAMTARGADFIDEPHLVAKLPDHELWMTFLRDPDGRPVGLMSEVR